MKKPSKTLSRGEAGGQAVNLTSAKRGFLSTAKIRMSAGRVITAPTIITACRETKDKNERRCTTRNAVFMQSIRKLELEPFNSYSQYTNQQMHLIKNNS
jgi:hypothetical protein